MTAQQLITDLSFTTLSGQTISDLTVAQNVTTLLSLLNMAKNKIAEDTLLWLGGETITMVADTYEYTMSAIPIQIIDVYDSNNVLRPRNSSDYFGYYQISPKKLKFNSITAGTEVYVNYYETPADYIITDTLEIPATLLSAMQFYITHKAFEIYKAESDILTSTEYYKKYKSAIQDFNNTSDSLDVDTVLSSVNKAWLRGIR